MSTGYPNWAVDPQRYAIAQEKWRHDQALYAFGEYAVFVLMWSIRDHDVGLVERCGRCVVAHGKIGETYNQPSQDRCPDCFGTTFDGGYRAIIVRPMLYDATGDSESEARRGVVVAAQARIQTTSDFAVRDGDYMFRGDGSRWQIKPTDDPNHLVTGFEVQTLANDIVGLAADAVREDESSVAYLIPPDATTLAAVLDVSHFHYPLDFSGTEDIRGALL